MVKELVGILERKTIDNPTTASEISKTEGEDMSEK
jgi:hypothetical protein